MAFTAPCVPTGMNIGVSTAPCGVVITPARAAPSVWVTRNEKAMEIGWPIGSESASPSPQSPVPSAELLSLP